MEENTSLLNEGEKTKQYSENNNTAKTEAQQPKKRRFGDRKDGYRVRDCDPMHAFMPYIMPNRADNEAVLNSQVEIANAQKFIEQKNAKLTDDFRYTLFHLVVAALAKTLYLRPKMNYFIQGHRLYERNVISFSFMVKKEFNDNSHEAFAIINFDKNSQKGVLDYTHGKIKKFVKSVRVEKKQDRTTNKIGFLTKMPRFMLKMIVGVLRFLDYHGWTPRSLMKDDPDYSSVFITNLGSIKMDASYHHLVNYGTNSFFVILGQRQIIPVFNDDGTYEMKKVVNLGVTIDERIADGVYFANSLRLFAHLMNNPELLDLPISEAVDFEYNCENPSTIKFK